MDPPASIPLLQVLCSPPERRRICPDCPGSQRGPGWPNPACLLANTGLQCLRWEVTAPTEPRVLVMCTTTAQRGRAGMGSIHGFVRWPRAPGAPSAPAARLLPNIGYSLSLCAPGNHSSSCPLRAFCVTHRPPCTNSTTMAAGLPEGMQRLATLTQWPTGMDATRCGVSDVRGAAGGGPRRGLGRP